AATGKPPRFPRVGRPGFRARPFRPTQRARVRAQREQRRRARQMLTVGDRLPDFRVQAVVSNEKGKEFKEVSNKDNAGKWLVLFFWPKDFTFVCPTEIAEFGKKVKDFADRDAVVLGGSTDNEF